MDSNRSRIVALLIVGLCASCNAGLAALVGSTQSGGSGSSNAPATLAAFAAQGTREAPAALRFVVTDPEGDSLALGLSYRIAGGPLQPLSAIGEENPTSYAGNAVGQEHVLLWDFTQELGFDAQGGYVDEVELFANVGGIDVPATPVEGQNTLSDLEFGNDAPVVGNLTPPAGEGSAIVLVEFVVSDSAGDATDLVVEYDVEGDDPDEGWRLARPAGQSGTPRVTIPNVLPDPSGTEVDFFWDTDVDLDQGDVSVWMRVTPSDEFDTGEAVTSVPFLVDNNDAPTLVVDELGLNLSSDRRHGLALGVTIQDVEADDLLVAFQWRREGETFPDLPTGRVEVEAMLDDPVQRAAMKLCTPVEHAVEGTLTLLAEGGVGFGPLSPRLSTLQGHFPPGVRFELLGSTSRLAMLDGVVAGAAAVALELGGERIGVLEDTGGSWRLQRASLVDGSVSTLASGTGTPIALERRLGHWVVAAVSGGGFELTTLEDDGAVVVSATGSGELHDIAAENPRLVYATIGDAVVRLGLTDAGLESQSLITGLADPRGIALDRWLHGKAYIAESGADRILVADLARRVVRPLPSEDVSGGVAWPQPGALALSSDGAQVYAVCDPGSSGTELRRRHLLRSRARADGSRGPLVDVVLEGESGLTDAGARLSAAEGVLAVAQPVAGTVGTLGVVELRRQVVGVTGSELLFGAPVDAKGAVGERQYRVHWRSGTYASTTEPEVRTFGWDTDADVFEPGEVFLRATPYDVDRGSGWTVQAPIGLEDPNRRVETAIGAEGGAVVADLDADGDLDIGAGLAGDSRVLLRDEEGLFADSGASIAFTTGGPGFGLSGLWEVVVPPAPALDMVAEDLDRDGRLDLLNAGSLGLEVAFQNPDGSFPATPSEFAYPIGSEGALRPIPVDLDGDGDLEVVVGLHGSRYLGFGSPDPPGILPGMVVVFDRVDVQGWSVAYSYLQAEGERLRFVEPLDTDGDGDLDLVLAQGSDLMRIDVLHVIHQQSEGDFAAVPTIFADLSPPDHDVLNISTVGELDVDEDGRLDIVTGHGFQQEPIWPDAPPVVNECLAWSRRTGVAEFDWLVELQKLTLGPELVGSFLPPSSQLSHVTLVDVDGDGRRDLYAESSQRQAWLRGKNTVFDPDGPVLLTVASPLGRLSSFVGDLDGDGSFDWVGAMGPEMDGVSPTPIVATTTGRGSLDFNDASELLDLFVSNEEWNYEQQSPYEVEVGDLDQDGDLDLLLATGDGGLQFGPTPGAAYVLLQTSPRRFTVTQALSPNGSGGCLDVELGDVDGDGLLDAVVVTPSNLGFGGEGLRLHRQVAPGVFDEAFTPLASGASAEIADAELVDLDLDGDLDVVASGEFNFELSLQESDGSWTASQLMNGHWVSHSGAGMWGGFDSEVADLDGDGRPDVVTGPADADFGTAEPGPFRLVYNRSDGSLETVNPTGEVGLESRAIEVHDVDGDGRPDLLHTTVGFELYLTLQQPDGSFGAPVLIEDLDSSNANVRNQARDAFQWRDVDGDGNVDLLFSGGTGLRIYTQEVRGQLVLARRIPVVNGGHAFGWVGDLDGDGELDFLTNVGGDAIQSIGGDLTVHWGGQQ